MRTGLREKGENQRGWTNSGYNTDIHGNVTMTQTKMYFYQKQRTEGKQLLWEGRRL
jgi:hypothetical protein